MFQKGVRDSPDPPTSIDNVSLSLPPVPSPPPPPSLPAPTTIPLPITITVLFATLGSPTELVVESTLEIAENFPLVGGSSRGLSGSRSDRFEVMEEE